MLFNSIEFAIFCPIVLVLYWALRFRAQNVFLLVASYVFYMAFDWRFLWLIIFQTVVDYVAGLGMGRNEDEAIRKRYLIGAISINLAVLAVFKYYGFFVDSAIDLFNVIGFKPNPPLLRIILPIGISFYTFQSITYSFDVYRRRVEPTRDFVAYAVFVAYFPHMVAGPIQQAKHLLPQVEHPRTRPGLDKVRSALFLILMGLFKKVAVADAVALVANKAFGSPNEVGSATLAIGLVAFALQIYGDFAGYSDMARGISRLFGIELTRNFEQPYLSRNITEFWRTWHISLSSWLHDYLYVPLGGNKGSKATTYRNLMITMLLGGLWHGASYNFIIWGGLHGALLAIHRAMGGYAPRGDLEPLRFRQIPKILGTFVIVCLVWTFFRAAEFTLASDYLRGLFSFRAGPVSVDDLIIVGFSALVILILDLSQRVTKDHEAVLRWHPALRGMAYAILILSVVLWSGGAAQPFIYFQF